MATLPAIVSHINAGVKFIDELVRDDERHGQVEQMNLHGNLIQSLDGLETFTGLVELCLSSNDVEKVAFHALQPLVHLRVLDLSANSISSTLGFPPLPRLEELSMAHNYLRGLEGLTSPIKFPELRYLDLRGNRFEKVNDLIPLQCLKRLSHLRCQAANGDQANPICDIVDYHHTIMKILPKLKLLDEEKVEFLKDMGSLRMPKCRSFMCPIVSKRSERHSNRSLRNINREPEAAAYHERGRQLHNRRFDDKTGSANLRTSSPRILTDVVSRESVGHPLGEAVHHDMKNRPAHSIKSPVPNSQPDNWKQKPQHRHVVNESGKNTGLNLEKVVGKREQVGGQKEVELLIGEKIVVTNETAFFVKGKDLKSQVANFEEHLKVAEARATRAEATVFAFSGHLLQKTKDQAAATADRTKSVNIIHCQKNQQHEPDAALAAPKEAHHEERLQHTAEKDSHEEIATQLSDKVKHHKEQIDKRNIQLENQVAQLKSDIQHAYNKCVGKDKTIRQLKKTLAACQDEIQMLILQHAKERERQDKLQQKKHDLYERRLQASNIQTQIEFRKEQQQSAQKLQLLEHKNQERLKEIKHVREAYQLSLRRERAAEAEVKQLQMLERAQRKVLEKRLIDDQKRYTQVAVLSAELNERTLESKQLRQALLQIEEQQDAWKKLEGGLRAAVEVKDVMLADQLHQIKALTNTHQNTQAQCNDEIAGLKVQVKNLGAALDENFRNAAEEEVKTQALCAKLATVENDALKREDQLNSLRT